MVTLRDQVKVMFDYATEKKIQKLEGYYIETSGGEYFVCKIKNELKTFSILCEATIYE